MVRKSGLDEARAVVAKDSFCNGWSYMSPLYQFSIPNSFAGNFSNL